MMEMFRQVMSGDMQQMKDEMKTNVKENAKENAKEIKEEMNGMKNKMDANMQAFRSDMRALRGETRQVGRCLQAGIMATPRAGANELRGSATAVGPAMKAGEAEIIRETCWARVVTEEVTVTQREKVNGVTETCTARHVETTETETREIEGEVKETKDEHTHTEVVEDNGGELTGCLETRCRQMNSLLQERGEGVCPLEAVYDQVGPVEPCEVEGMSEADGCTQSLGGYGGPGSPRGDANPQRVCPGVCGVEVCVYECGEMRAATHA